MDKQTLKTGYNQTSTLLGNAFVEVLSANPRRMAIVVSPGGLTSLRVSFGSTETAANGMRIPVNGTPLVFDRITFGDAICQPMFMSAPDAAETVTVGEFNVLS